MGSVAQLENERVTVGVDSHRDSHTADVKNFRGASLANAQFPATQAGYEALVAWAQCYGEIDAFGIEGTGSYAAGLTRFVLTRGYKVFEVTRPERKARRNIAKSDPLDAQAAARAVQAGEASALPKTGDGPVEMLRMLTVVRSSAIKSRTQAINGLRSLVVTAPEELRREVAELKLPQLLQVCAEFAGDTTSVAEAARLAMGELARRILDLYAEVKGMDWRMKDLVATTAPALVALHGVGTQTAAQLLVTAGDNPDRIGSEASFARLCGVAPLEASSGLTVRHRLNRGGDRQANAALHTVVIVRLGTHAPTQAYVARRLQEGKTKREIIRCLKRYVAREIYHVLCPKAIKPDTVAA